MTPAVTLARKLNIRHTVHEYEHDPGSDSYGLEAAEKLNLPPERVFKTLVARLDSGELVVGVLPASSKLNLKLLAKAGGAKKALMAPGPDVERSSGYVLGGVSPLGQRKRLRTFIDSSARTHRTIHVSAGRRGLEIELSPEDLRKVLDGRYAEISR